ncbi:unnamed protein product, partial [Mesorhabditis belari]|uniref:Uncharacterized protein n=1 Tax=Mesorhabditis belari TaxID=2138241 RepID=A0AAF3FKU1_9BILA
MQMFRCFLYYFILNFLNAQRVLLNKILPLSEPLRPSNNIRNLLRNAAGFNTVIISKTMSQTTLLTLCDLLRQQRGLPQKNLEIGKNRNLCMKQNWYHQVPSKNLKWIINGNSPALIVVRDPIERFVSMYAYLCKEKYLCPARMNIHRFAKWTNRLLLKVDENDEYNAVLGHIQPSFWFAYENGESLPDGNLELKPQLLAALQRHRIKLPDQLMPTINGGAVLEDDCMGSRLSAAPEKSIPRYYCDL